MIKFTPRDHIPQFESSHLEMTLNNHLLRAALIAFSSVTAIAYGQTATTNPSRTPYLVTKNHTICLHTYRGDDEIDLCTEGSRTIAENAQMAEALRLRDAKRAEDLKPDPSTPLFNRCAEGAKYDYNYAGKWCRLELIHDVERLSGWFSKGDAAIAADRSGELRLDIMKQIRDEEIDAIREKQRNRRYRQTALENLIDKANEPCMYADQNNIMRSCD